jgi:DtxR family Mn-dependent transcriptional regulator
MSEPLSHNVQDYLKQIYEITRVGGRASTSQLAETLGISPASVTNMVQKLSQTQPPYVTYEKHKGVELTETGKVIALNMIRRHRLIEHYLVKALGYTWDEVHQEAEILEHAMSPLLVKRIDAALGFPKFDPHGDPIPDANLQLPEVEQTSLNQVKIGHSGTILRVPNEDPQVLRYLGKCGLRPGAKIKLLSRTPYDQTMQIKVFENNEVVVIGPGLGSKISIFLD